MKDPKVANEIEVEVAWSIRPWNRIEVLNPTNQLEFNQWSISMK